MNSMAITLKVQGKIEDVCQRVVEAIKPVGFGVLTQIDFDKKIKEKIGETISPCVILGACNPKLAYAVYQQSSDVALFMPCNIVLTEVSADEVRVEAIRPTQMLAMLPAIADSSLVKEAEESLEKALKDLS